jgi:predicted regulator of Ras-like GTPase activity (Roadblock/LC7/MglB family)
VPAVEAAEALADLTEISTQIRLAVLVDERGELVASAGAEPAQADTVARLVRELLSAAEDAMGGAQAREELVQLQASTPGGCVFLVRDEGRLVASVTVPEPTAGLVFYDLKTCLRTVAGESLAPKPTARAGSKAAEADSTAGQSGPTEPGASEPTDSASGAGDGSG